MRVACSFDFARLRSKGFSKSWAGSESRMDNVKSNVVRFVVTQQCCCFAQWQRKPVQPQSQLLTQTIAGPGSLRQALANANDGDTITFRSDWLNHAHQRRAGDSPKISPFQVLAPINSQLMEIRAGGVFGTMPGTTVAISGLTVRNAQVGISNDSGVLTRE